MSVLCVTVFVSPMYRGEIEVVRSMHDADSWHDELFD